MPPWFLVMVFVTATETPTRTGFKVFWLPRALHSYGHTYTQIKHTLIITKNKIKS